MNTNRKFDQHYNEEYEQQIEKSPKYQPYQHINTQSAKLRELLFFVQIAGFCISTIISCLILLSLQVKVIMAFPLAMIISFTLLLSLKFYINYRKRRG